MIIELYDTGYKLTEEKKFQAIIWSILNGWEYLKLHLTHALDIENFDDMAYHLKLEEDCLAFPSVKSKENLQAQVQIIGS